MFSTLCGRGQQSRIPFHLCCMLVKTAEYTGSYVKADKCPKADLPEFAFIGRSNVGKSSLINYLTGRKKLVKVSVTPGKTQTINYFLINNRFNLVDLPGYGFAKISQEQRKKWLGMINDYMLNRKQLQFVAVLIDSRIPPQEIDLRFIDFLGEHQLPFFIVFTKADKQGSREVSANVQNFKNTLLQSWEVLPPCFITSSEKKLGGDQIWNLIETCVNEYKPQA